MHVKYCDLCGLPIKCDDCHTLYRTSPNTEAPDANNYENVNDYYRDYDMYLRRIEKEIKEICPTCNQLIDKIFEYRLQGMTRLAEECADMFNLPPKDEKKKKRQ